MNQPPPNGPGPHQGPPYGMPPTGGRPPAVPAPPGGPYVGYPPPTTDRRTSAWVWISLGCGGLFVVGVLLVGVLLFVVADNDDSSGAGSASDSGTEGGTSSGLGDEERSNPDMPGLGERVEHAGMLFTIVEVETGVTSVGYHSPDNEYVVMHVEVEPAGSRAVEFWRDEQHLYTYSGRPVPEDYEATRDHEVGVPMGVEVSPGEPQVVTIVFDVRDPSEISHMGLSAEFLGGNEVYVDVTG
ncbi:MAG: hypothetical protein JK586_10040 [Nocardiopsis sp. BM-2018]|nr:MAG: hypothetical protein JK586_10040 [Nocardiopsis sp. BM-2018]